jgi:RNA polymerase sigma factor (sigma-70 family)
VFVVAHRKLPEFEGRSSVSTWLYRIALRVAAAERRRARHRCELLCDEPPPSASGDLRGELEQRALLEHLADAIDRLSDTQRAALMLHDFEGLRMREVARRLRIPLKTAFSRSYAARKAIADELRRLGYALPAWWPLWPGNLQRLLRVPRQLAFAPAHALWIALGMCVLMQTPARPMPEVLPPLAATPHTTVARSAPSPASPEPPPSAATPQPSRRRAPLRRVVDAPALTAVAPADTTPPNFQIIHMSAEDPAPPREHPFAARLRESTPHVTPMAARLAPRTLEPALLATTFGAR